MSPQSTTIVDEELEQKIRVVNFFTPKKTKFSCVRSNYSNEEDLVQVQNLKWDGQNRDSEMMSMALLSVSYIQSDLPDQKNRSKKPLVHIHRTW
jgi:hypothetical protein